MQVGATVVPVRDQTDPAVFKAPALGGRLSHDKTGGGLSRTTGEKVNPMQGHSSGRPGTWLEWAFPERSLYEATMGPSTRVLSKAHPVWRLP